MGRVTDDERREVARRLREFARDKWQLTVGGNSATIRYATSDIVFGDKKYHSGVDLLDRLADLIEPSCDRDALLTLADEMDEVAQRRRSMGYEGFAIGDEDRARRIREALEVTS